MSKARVTRSHYVAQGRGLLPHLGFDKTYLIGGCVDCYPVAAFVAAHPESMTLFWPVGGARNRLTNQQRFATPPAFVRANGLAAVAEVARARQVVRRRPVRPPLGQ